MKHYILLIYFLAFSLSTEANTAVKDSLSGALSSASSPLQKLEIMTNLMDISRQEEQVEYAKQLYKLALEEDEDYYKEAALTDVRYTEEEVFQRVKERIHGRKTL